MNKDDEVNIKDATVLAKRLTTLHLGAAAKEINHQPAGKTNQVFEVKTKDGNFIIRIGLKHSMPGFIKEEWAIRSAAEKGVPVPRIIAIGDKDIPFPYMIQEKLSGKEAVNHPDRLDILRALGGYARSIHSISTTGYGHVFEGRKHKHAKYATWREFLDNELEVANRLSFLERHQLLPVAKFRSLVGLVTKIKQWDPLPALNHGDLRLKNVIVSRSGRIQAIIDWENCASSVAPYWDFSIALHDLSIDGKQKFLEGYGLDLEEFSGMAYALTVFNLLNYIPDLQKLVEKNDRRTLELYKLRLNGSLDLFSL